MARRKQLTALATAINICDHLSADDIATLVDVLMSRNGAKPVTPKPLVNLAGKKSSTKSGASTGTASIKGEEEGAGSVVKELREATGKSVSECAQALKNNGGDKKAALLALTSEGS